jgi:ERCC4-type nuclease
LSQKELEDILLSVKGIGVKKFENIVDELGGVDEVVGVLEQSPSILINIKGICKKLVKKISDKWDEYKRN